LNANINSKFSAIKNTLTTREALSSQDKIVRQLGDHQATRVGLGDSTAEQVEEAEAEQEEKVATKQMMITHLSLLL